METTLATMLSLSVADPVRNSVRICRTQESKLKRVPFPLVGSDGLRRSLPRLGQTACRYAPPYTEGPVSFASLSLDFRSSRKAGRYAQSAKPSST